MNEQDEYGGTELPAGITSVLEHMRDRPVQDDSLTRVLDQCLSGEDTEVDACPQTSTGIRLPVNSRFSAVLAVAASLLIMVTAGWSAFRPIDAWANVAEAVQEMPWVRLTANADQWAYESWFAPSRRILASRIGSEVTYVNIAAGERVEFDSQNNRLYRLPLADHRSANSLETFRDLLTSTELRPGSEFAGFKLIDQNSRTVINGNQKWRDIELNLERDHHTLKMVVRTDTVTKLPISVDMTHDGQKRTFSFDYPTNGPEDIYALGIPRDVRIVDRIPPRKVTEVLAKLHEGHDSFGDYTAIIGGARGVPEHLIRRSGNRWRLDRCVPTDRVQPLPENRDQVVALTKDNQWWQERLGHYDLQPVLVCDGKYIYRYRNEGRQQTAKPDVTSQRGLVKGSFSAPFPVTAPSRIVDPSVPLRFRRGGRYDITSLPETYYLNVERFAYPPFKAGGEFTMNVSAATDDDPDGTLVLECEAVVPSRFLMFRRTRRWLDPALRYAVVKEETLGFPHIDRDGDPFGHLDQTDQFREFDEFRESPTGFFYPTVVRWINVRAKDDAGGASQDITTYFHLDFDADMPDTLFAVPDAVNQIEGDGKLGARVSN